VEKLQQQDKFLLYFTGPSGCVWEYQQLGIREEPNFTKKNLQKRQKIDNFLACLMSIAVVMYW
jgi:hypothetical protein